MNNTIQYKGYVGSVEFFEDDGIFYGKIIGIRPLSLTKTKAPRNFLTISKLLWTIIWKSAKLRAKNQRLLSKAASTLGFLQSFTSKFSSIRHPIRYLRTVTLKKFWKTPLLRMLSKHFPPSGRQC